MGYLERRLKVGQAYAEFIKHYPLTVDSLDGEEWRNIEGFDAAYQVSNYGRIKSFKLGREHILKPRLQIFEYLIVGLQKGGKQKPYVVHRLVAKAFIPNPENKPQVNHIDGCKLNACASNLEWATPKENIQHAHASGLAKNAQGGDDSQAKLTNEQAKYVRDNPNNLTGNALAKMFGVDAKVISRIQMGKGYKNAGGAIRNTPKQNPDRVPDGVRNQIRAEYKKGTWKHGAAALARKYNLCVSTVTVIVNEK